MFKTSSANTLGDQITPLALTTRVFVEFYNEMTLLGPAIFRIMFFTSSVFAQSRANLRTKYSIELSALPPDSTTRLASLPIQSLISVKAKPSASAFSTDRI